MKCWTIETIYDNNLSRSTPLCVSISMKSTPKIFQTVDSSCASSCTSPGVSPCALPCASLLASSFSCSLNIFSTNLLSTPFAFSTKSARCIQYCSRVGCQSSKSSCDPADILTISSRRGVRLNMLLPQFLQNWRLNGFPESVILSTYVVNHSSPSVIVNPYVRLSAGASAVWLRKPAGESLLCRLFFDLSRINVFYIHFWDISKQYKALILNIVYSSDNNKQCSIEAWLRLIRAYISLCHKGKLLF